MATLQDYRNAALAMVGWFTARDLDLATRKLGFDDFHHNRVGNAISTQRGRFETRMSGVRRVEYRVKGDDKSK